MLGLNGIYKGLYIYSSQKGHDRRKIKRGNDIWRLEGSKNKKNNWDMKWADADAELAFSNALGWIVLDLDIWVGFGFNGFKIIFFF